MSNEMMLERVRQGKVIAIVRRLTPEEILPLADALYQAGIRMLEVTFDQKHPESEVQTTAAISALSEKFGDRMLLGAGTVLTTRQLVLARDAGAQYIVTPNTNPQLIRAAKALGMGAFPGALTPSEIAAAAEAGADAVKVFPAGTLGVSYIKAISAPLSHIPLLAVGGVDEKNAADFIRAGCVGVGMGGNLVNKEWIRQGRWDEITALARRTMLPLEALYA